MTNLLGGGMLTGDKIRKEIKKGNIKISDYDPECMNPNSYNLKLHPQLLIYKRDAVRANVIEGKLPQPVQVGVDYVTDALESPEAIKSRLHKESKPGNGKRSKKKQKTSQFIIHESENSTNGISEDDTATKIYNSATYSESKYAVISRMDVADNAIKTINDSITASDKKLDNLRERSYRSVAQLTDSVKTGLEISTINDISLEKEINKLGMYPNIESACLPPLDMRKQNETIEFEIPEEGFVLQPGVLYIGRTKERTWTDKYIPMINGRSSGGRLGISIHICAGFGDIGFDGTWTLEITCVEPVRIYPDSEIAQVCFFKPYGKVKDLYRGRYFQQEAATASRFEREKGDNSNE